MSTPAGQTAQHSVDGRALQDLRAAVDRVEQVLVDLDNGAHASSGRDFGRGVAYAARLVTEALQPAHRVLAAGSALPDVGGR